LLQVPNLQVKRLLLNIQQMALPYTAVMMRVFLLLLVIMVVMVTDCLDIQRSSLVWLALSVGYRA